MKDEEKTKPKLSIRCLKCRRKVLFLVDCHCGNHYCLECRYPEKHECTFDFKKQGAIELIKNNPVVTREKISKI
jgi:hypothetical protein